MFVNDIFTLQSLIIITDTYLSKIFKILNNF